MTFARWRNRPTTHFSERIPDVEWCMTVYVWYKTCVLLILWNQNSLFGWHCLWSTEIYTSLLLLNCGRDAGSDEPRLLLVSTHWLVDLFAGWKKSETAVCMPPWQGHFCFLPQRSGHNVALRYCNVPCAVSMVGQMTEQNHQSMLKKRSSQNKSEVHFSAIHSSSCIYLCLISAGTDRNSFDIESMDWVLVISGLTLWRKCIYSLTHLLHGVESLRSYQVFSESKNSPHFMEPEGSLPPSQVPPPIYAWVSQEVSFPQVSPPKPCMRFSFPPYALYNLPISFFSILSPEQYWERSWRKCIYVLKNISLHNCRIQSMCFQPLALQVVACCHVCIYTYSVQTTQ